MFTAAEVAARLELEGLLPDGPSPRALARIDDMAEKVMSYLNTDNIPDGLVPYLLPAVRRVYPDG